MGSYAWQCCDVIARSKSMSRFHASSTINMTDHESNGRKRRQSCHSLTFLQHHASCVATVSLPLTGSFGRNGSASTSTQKQTKKRKKQARVNSPCCRCAGACGIQAPLSRLVTRQHASGQSGHSGTSECGQGSKAAWCTSRLCQKLACMPSRQLLQQLLGHKRAPSRLGMRPWTSLGPCCLMTQPAALLKVRPLAACLLKDAAVGLGYLDNGLWTACQQHWPDTQRGPAEGVLLHLANVHKSRSPEC